MAAARIDMSRDRAERWKRPARLTPIYHRHGEMRATMIECEGWMLPHSYRDVSDELRTVATAAGLLDIGDTGKIDLQSTDVDSVLSRSFPELVTVPVGRIAAAAVDTWICRLTSDGVLIVTSASASSAVFQQVDRSVETDPTSHATDISGALCGLRLLGPAAPDVLQRLSALDLAPDRFTHHSLAQGMLAQVRVLVVRRDAAGLAGYDLYADRDLGVYLWDSLLHVGASLGLLPVGRVAEEVIG